MDGPKNLNILEYSEKINNKYNNILGNENYFSKPNSPKYNIGINLPKKGNSKKNKNTPNIFVKTRYKKDLYIKNPDENVIENFRLRNEKSKVFKLNYYKGDYFQTGYPEKRKRRNKSKNNFDKNEYIIFGNSNSTFKSLDIENLTKNKNSKSFKNKDSNLTLKNYTELSSIKKDKLIFSSSLNNLKEYTNKTTNNLTSPFSQSLKSNNISVKTPSDKLININMNNEILNILDLNNNIEINKQEFKTINNMSHSHSTKSFTFTKRKNPKKIDNSLSEKIIYDILKSSSEFDNKEEENKIASLEKEIEKIKNEYTKIKLDKNKLENSLKEIKNDINFFYRQRDIEKQSFEKYKENEIKKLVNETNQISKEKKTFDDLKIKYQNNEYNYKDENITNDKELINFYKNKLEAANNEIFKLKNILNNLNINNSFEYFKNDINADKISQEEDDESEDNDEDNYDLILPDIYHKETYNLIKTETNKEGNIINIYDKNKNEIILKNGDRKEIYGEKYEITYFANGDIKEVFNDNNKQIYYFKNQKITKTTLGKGLQIIKYNDNEQLEKIFSNGTKKISFSDGRLKYILPNGIQETYFPDGSIERIYKDGSIMIEKGEGFK